MIRLKIAAVLCALGLAVACGGEKPAADPSSPPTAAATNSESISPGEVPGAPAAPESGAGATPQGGTATPVEPLK